MTGRRQLEPPATVVGRIARRMAQALPDLSLAAALESVSDVANRYTVRELDEHLATHPDALTSGSSAVPMSVLLLATRLAEDGNDKVQVPTCLRCGTRTLLRYRVEGGRICDRCHRLAHHAPCTDCHRDRVITTRDEQGLPLCASCRKSRRKEACGRCGRPSQRVAARCDDGSALCPNCYNAPIRTCSRCGQDAPNYCNTPAGPTCKSCYERPQRRCGACGQIRRIDQRANDGEPDLCCRCSTRKQRPCTVCGNFYPANPRAALPVCLPCRETGKVLEPNLFELPPRTHRHPNETAYDVLRKKLLTLLSHPDHGVAPQLLPLLDVFGKVTKPAPIIQWLHQGQGGPALLRELAVRAHDEPLTHQLLDVHLQNNALHRIRALMVFAGILPERAELLERIEPWLDQTLADRPAHHLALVHPFAVWHALRRARQRARRRPTTPHSATYVRTQITVALNFLQWLDQHGQTLSGADQTHLDSWLADGGQTNYFLASFIGWARARGLCDLTVHHRPTTDPATFLDPADGLGMLRRCLHDQTLPTDIRAAGILVLLLGRTTTSFNNLTVADLHQVGGETHLRLDGLDTLLPPRRSQDLPCPPRPNHRQGDVPPSRPRHPIPIPRPNPRTAHGQLRPEQEASHPRHQRAPRPKLGPGDLGPTDPHRIAADLLGIHITTATKWASRTRRDWANYVAARAEADQHGNPNQRPER